MLVTGEYDASEVAGQEVDMMVTDTKGQHFVNRFQENTLVTLNLAAYISFFLVYSFLPVY